ncbi:phage baseplate assembly protein [Caballeronia sp. S22]|uniref:phage baseplate assembly protein n=1 Tax=Caballeronia sp. S22 TaxID=3137182 RepID=UPI0035308556
MINSNFAPNDITLVVSTCTRGSAGLQSYTTTNSRTISGWTSVRVSRGIERMPSDFEVSFTEVYPGASDLVVQAGDEVEVYLGANVVLSGFIDAYIPSYNAREHTIRIAGRSRSQDLVDCSAYWPAGQMLNVKVDQIAKNLCTPYGITVNVAAGTVLGTPIEQLNIFPGQTPYEVIEMVCRYKALIFYDQPDGSMTIASGGEVAGNPASSGIGVRKASSGFKEGVNVESASFVSRMDGRFSDYDALYMGLDTLQDIGKGGNLIARIADAGVPRFRFRAIVAENVKGGLTVAEQRANWELVARMGRSMQVRLSTDSWRDSSGTLYEPNTLVDIDLPTLKLEPKTWLIADVTYTRDERGTRADLLIMPPQAFYQEPFILFPVSPDVNKVKNVNS